MKVLQILNKQFDEERALYHLENAVVENCVFAGKADGESVLKESRNIDVSHCSFSLRYPLWHTCCFTLSDSVMDELTRAPLWYAKNGKITNTIINGIKCLRECSEIQIDNCKITSPEFGWKCSNISITNSNIESEYSLFEGKNICINNLKMTGKYSFQYIENMDIDNSVLDTKDAFWHSKNVTVKNSVIKGEYLGWYSDGLTLINCQIIGTQPLCYCKDLKLVNCTMVDTDLAFEYSSVYADIKGSILSVKNPESGKISADEIGEIVMENSIMHTDCEIEIRSNE